MIIIRTFKENYFIRNVVLFISSNDVSNVSSSFVFTKETFENYYYSLIEILDNEDIDLIYEQLCNYEASEDEIKDFKNSFKNKQ